MSLDWKNIDFSALLKSQVVLGSAVTIITGLMAVGGHSIPDDQKSQLTEGLSQILNGISALAGIYTLFHRVVAQPDGQTTIVPKKDPDAASKPS
jgi:hypothetical protein